MKRTPIRLSDGRELIYFDEAADTARNRSDQRALPPASTASEIRRDLLADEWVAVASHRQARTHLPPSDECPLCPSSDDRLTEIPEHDYDVVVFENRFASFAQDVLPVSPLPDPGQSLVERRSGLGRCEVVCFSSQHDASFAQLTHDRVRTVLEAWVDRTSALSRLPGVEQVFAFENRGREIGVTLSHPHGQIYAYPFITPVTRRMLVSARAHEKVTSRNLFDEVLAAEIRAGVRVLGRTQHWTTFVPVAARWPFEVHVFPNRRVPDLPALTDDERADFAAAYLDVLRRLDGLFGVQMPYISAWHQAPVVGEEPGDRARFGLHLRVFSTRRDPDKLKFLAGSESAMGVFINDVAPERAAELLRSVRL